MSFEALVAAALLLLALFPLRHHPQLGRSRAVLVIVAAGLVGSVAVGWTIVRNLDRIVEEQDVRNRPIQLAGEGYVSSGTCQSCHPEQYASWKGSYHPRMTQVATPQAVVAPFAGVELESRGKKYRLGHAEDEFWVEMDDPENGAGRGPVRRRIVLTTGSHHEQDYWFETGQGRRIGRLPFVYRIPEQQWIPDVSVLLTPPDSPIPFGNWHKNCTQCHVTRGRPRIHGPAQVDTTVGEFGIACEACHGPGERHVRANRDPRRRYEFYGGSRPDRTIVNPRRLSARLSSHVCGQCHGLSFITRDYEREYAKDGWRYRPGRDLEETRRLRPDAQELAAQSRCNSSTECPGTSFWADGMIRVSGREHNGLIESPCYRGGDFSCLSCHTMHRPTDDPRSLKQWADDQLTLGMDSNQACLQCHPQFEGHKRLTDHTHHQPDSTGSSCYNCHMPHTTWGLLKAIRSHQIDSPTVTSSLQTGRPNACNLCHLDKTLAWTSDHLEAWHLIPGPRLTADQRSIAASVLWILSGDAGQRALVAWSMGWHAAQQVSGSHWMGPYLAQLLEDPYDAVRFAAYRSLRQLPEFSETAGRDSEFHYSFVGSPDHRRTVRERAFEIWGSTKPAGQEHFATEMLVEARGVLKESAFRRLLEQRDDRRMHLNE